MVFFFYNPFKRLATMVKIDWKFENIGGGRFKPLMSLMSYVRMTPEDEQLWINLIRTMFILLFIEVVVVIIGCSLRYRRKRSVKALLMASGTELNDSQTTVLQDAV